MPVPLLDVRRQNDPLERELKDAFSRVLASGQYILGPEVERFEAAAAEVAGARFAVGMSSGTDALLAALMALDVGPGDEVICPAFTFFATAGCVARLGARPVFADCCPQSFNLDPAGLARRITARTRAIVPVHLFGQPAAMEEILAIAGRAGVAVVEDAAQAFGARYRGKPVGALGACGIVSFYPTKNLGGFGDAGLLVTDDAALAARARALRNHGAGEQYVHPEIGGNFRLDEIQAALLAVKLPRLAGYSAARQAHAAVYTRLFAPLEDRGVVLPAIAAGVTHIFNQYTLRVPGRRDALRRFLAERGIASGIYYPVPLHRQQCFEPFGPHPALPVTERLASEVLSLPVSSEIHEEEVGAVAAAVLEFFESGA